MAVALKGRSQDKRRKDFTTEDREDTEGTLVTGTAGMTTRQKHLLSSLQWHQAQALKHRPSMQTSGKAFTTEDAEGTEGTS